MSTHASMPARARANVLLRGLAAGAVALAAWRFTASFGQQQFLKGTAPRANPELLWMHALFALSLGIALCFLSVPWLAGGRTSRRVLWVIAGALLAVVVAMFLVPGVTAYDFSS